TFATRRRRTHDYSCRRGRKPAPSAHPNAKRRAPNLSPRGMSLCSPDLRRGVVVTPAGEIAPRLKRNNEWLAEAYPSWEWRTEVRAALQSSHAPAPRYAGHVGDDQVGALRLCLALRFMRRYARGRRTSN